MPPDPARAFRPRMTLRQIGLLVVFAAVSFAIAAPLWRSPNDLADSSLVAAVEVPYALLPPALLLVRRGPLKNWGVAALCSVPLLALLIFVNHLAAIDFIVYLPNGRISDIPPGILVVFGIIDAVLLGGLAYLGRWLIPRICPNCRRPSMLRNPGVPRSRDFPGRGDAVSCLACGSRFRRARSGPWVDVDDLDRQSPRPTPIPTPKEAHR